jgi:hypothetical protein
LASVKFPLTSHMQDVLPDRVIERWALVQRHFPHQPGAWQKSNATMPVRPVKTAKAAG